MPKYKYTVINKENKQLSGTINAPDEVAARKELNGLGFSIVAMATVNEDLEQTAVQPQELEGIKKFEFQAIDKNGKKVMGTIQGEDIYPVFKRLLSEYQFDVKALYDESLMDEDKETAIQKGVDELKDRLTEEQFIQQSSLEKAQQDQVDFENKQRNLKEQVDFVLKKVSEFIDTYKDDFRPEMKAKIKYHVDKILRIKNSTNLEYIKQACADLLNFMQQEELFIHTEQKMTEKNQLTMEAKMMMMQLNRVNNPNSVDIFESLKTWRINNIINNPTPGFSAKLINLLITPLIGQTAPPPEILEMQAKIKQTTEQLKQYITIFFKSTDQGFKAETKKSIRNVWEKRKSQVRELHEIRKRLRQEHLKAVEFTGLEIFLKEIYKLAGWVLTFYIIYYFGTIYLNSKQINLFQDSKIGLIFQTSIIKFFFTSLFLFVCFLGIKLEFFKRKKFSTPAITLIFILCSLLIILNF
jgi:hypothetical protein